MPRWRMQRAPESKRILVDATCYCYFGCVCRSRIFLKVYERTSRVWDVKKEFELQAQDDTLLSIVREKVSLRGNCFCASGLCFRDPGFGSRQMALCKTNELLLTRERSQTGNICPSQLNNCRFAWARLIVCSLHTFFSEVLFQLHRPA